MMPMIYGSLQPRVKADMMFFEQDGSFVVRILGTGAGGTISHRLAEFTREEIVAMIDEAPHLRDSAPAARNTAQGEAST